MVLKGKPAPWIKKMELKSQNIGAIAWNFLNLIKGESLSLGDFGLVLSVAATE